MKTNTYDLNLYVIDGYVKVLAHQLEFASDGHVQCGGNFSTALSIQLKRANKAIWQPIVDFFEGTPNTEVYEELDSWRMAPVADMDTPHKIMPYEDIEAMPPVLATVVSYLPQYEMKDWR